MKHNKLSELSDEKLLKKRNLFKGITIGFGIVIVLIIVWLIYIFLTKGFNDIPLTSLIPIIALSTIFSTLFISLGQCNRELKSRNLQ